MTRSIQRESPEATLPVSTLQQISKSPFTYLCNSAAIETCHIAHKFNRWKKGILLLRNNKQDIAEYPTMPPKIGGMFYYNPIGWTEETVSIQENTISQVKLVFVTCWFPDNKRHVVFCMFLLFNNN